MPIRYNGIFKTVFYSNEIGMVYLWHVPVLNEKERASRTLLFGVLHEDFCMDAEDTNSGAHACTKGNIYLPIFLLCFNSSTLSNIYKQFRSWFPQLQNRIQKDFLLNDRKDI